MWSLLQHSGRSRPRRALWLAVCLAVAMTAALVPATRVVHAQDDTPAERLADSPDPATAAVQISEATFDDGEATRVVVGRLGVFADTLVGSSLSGEDGPVLFIPGGTRGEVPAVVAEEIQRVLGDEACVEGLGAAGTPGLRNRGGVVIVGGTAAINEAASDALGELAGCVERVAGPTRVETAAAVAAAVGLPESGQVIVATAVDWPDSGAVAAYASDRATPIVLTGPDDLHPAAQTTLQDLAPTEIVIIGGVAALTEQVETALEQIAPTTRVAGPSRDVTAIAILEELWTDDPPVERVLVTGGFAEDAWVWLFGLAPYAARNDAPILLASEQGVSAATSTLLDSNPEWEVQQIGPPEISGPDLVDPAPSPAPSGSPTPTPAPSPMPTPTEQPQARPSPDLDALGQLGLEPIAFADGALDLTVRPGTDEVWIAQREGEVVVLRDGAATTGDPELAVDLSQQVGVEGEGGLLGLVFNADGSRLYLSSTDDDAIEGEQGGTSRLQEFPVAPDGTIDPTGGQTLLTVPQPATNHNGGDVVLTDEGDLLWALGDGGGGDDRFNNGQDTTTLLAGLLRITPDGEGGYQVPGSNPFAAAPELWTYGLRNPFRISLDPYTDEVWVGNVGQGGWEEVNLIGLDDHGANFGWPNYEGSELYQGPALPDRVDPVHQYRTRAPGNCAITGGAVYSGSAIPALRGAYVFADWCAGDLMAIAVEDGETRSADLEVSASGPISFAEGPDGELWVVESGGGISRLVGTS